VLRIILRHAMLVRILKCWCVEEYLCGLCAVFRWILRGCHFEKVLGIAVLRILSGCCVRRILRALVLRSIFGAATLRSIRRAA